MSGQRLKSCRAGLLGIAGDRAWAIRDETSHEITNGRRIPVLIQCAASYRDEPIDGSIPNVDITLPSGVSLGSDEAIIDQVLSDVLGKPVTLWPLQPSTNKQHYRRAGVMARVAGQLSRLASFRALLTALTVIGGKNRRIREKFSREANEPLPDISLLPQERFEFVTVPGTYFDVFPIHILTTSSLKTMSSFNSTAVWDVRRFRPNFVIATNEELRGLPEANWGGRNLKLGTMELHCEIPTTRCSMTTHAQNDLPKDASVLRSIVKEASQNLGVYASVVREGRVSEGDTVELI